MPVIALFCGAFLAVLFLQSGLDKVLDRSGNLAYFVEVTKRGPLKKWARATLNLMTLVEVLAGALSAAGTLLWVVDVGNGMLEVGAFLSAVAILMLFAGQRLNRDYAGAAGIVPYFLVTLVAIAAQR